MQCSPSIAYFIFNDRFLAQLAALYLLLLRRDAQPIIAMKMIRLSIAYGMSKHSPVGLIAFGHIIAKAGDISEGCRYVKIAQKLLDKMNSKDVAGEIIAIGTQLLCFVEPIQTTIEWNVEGRATAMASGDTLAAMMNTTFQCNKLFWAGFKLPVCKKENAAARRSMEEYNHVAFLSNIISLEKIVFTLMGEQHDNMNEHPNSNQVENHLQHNIRKKNPPHASRSVDFHKMYMSFMLREYDQVKASAEKFFDYRFQPWTLLYSYTAQSFHAGLVSFWVFRQSKESIWHERGSKAKFAMMKWAESSRHNFQHKVYLLEA